MSYEYIVPAAHACNIFRTQNPSLGSHYRPAGVKTDISVFQTPCGSDKGAKTRSGNTGTTLEIVAVTKGKVGKIGFGLY